MTRSRTVALLAGVLGVAALSLAAALSEPTPVVMDPPPVQRCPVEIRPKALPVRQVYSIAPGVTLDGPARPVGNSIPGCDTTWHWIVRLSNNETIHLDAYPKEMTVANGELVVALDPTHRGP